MKFSVVIPCHDRLELLREAIYTVKAQDFSDWELFIFDNASKSDIATFVKSLNDDRIHTQRSDEFLPVTESWNRAIEMATGDYVVFLGDDDGLIPKYFSRLIPLIQKFEQPEIIYSAFYQFWHPGVAPWKREGHLIEIKNGFFFVGQKEPFLLSENQAIKAVQGSISLQRNFSYNTQAFVFSQRFLHNLKKDGPIFRSPFPDYYMANVAFARSQSTLVIPEPMCVAGVSKASVGYTIYNGLEDRFMEILNTDLNSDPIFNEIKEKFLPGPIYDTKYILSMEHVVRYLQSPLFPKVAFKRYRRLRIYEVIVDNRKHKKRFLDAKLWNQISFGEKLWACFVRFLMMTIRLDEHFWDIIKKILDQVNKSYSRGIRLFFCKKLSSHAFRTLARDHDTYDCKKLVEVFDALHEESLICK